MTCSNCGAALTSPAGVSLMVCPFCQTDNSKKKQIAASRGESYLRDEFLRRGKSLYSDERVLKSLIDDYFADNPKLLKILRLAVQENIAAKIIEVLPYAVEKQKIHISSLVSYFTEDFGMSKARAAEAVRTLAFGAGLADEVLTWLDIDISNTGDGVSPGDTPPERQKNSMYQFDGHDWRVLDEQNGKALLLREKIWDACSYHEPSESITWEDCTLRKKLNYEFYNQITQKERSRIIKTHVSNSKNLWFDTDGGGDTQDYVFLLSIDEVVRYFGDSGMLKRGNSPVERGGLTWPAYGIYENSFSDQYNKNRIARNENDRILYWWLRSPGSRPHLVATVDDSGGISMGGLPALWLRNPNSGGVRPALWINL